ncbi:MAG: glycosyltransferase [Microbacterium sp.]
MKITRWVVLGVLAIAVVAGLGVSAALSPAWAVVLLGVLQLVVLALLVDTRRVLSVRMLSAMRNFEHRLNRRLSGGAARQRRGTASTAPASASASAREVDSPPGATSHSRDVQLVKASLIFDQEWYETQIAGSFSSLDRAISHYLTRGRRKGFSPHPLFSPAWVLPGRWSQQDQDPLISYLRNQDALQERPTSVFFDPAHLDDRLPPDEFGPLTSFLRERGSDAPLPYDAEGIHARAGITLDEVRSFLLEQCDRWRQRELLLAPTRGSEDAPAVPQDLIAARAELTSRRDDLPLVSVILPTWNRAGLLRAAIDSVVRQSYARWELIVADDGSIDDTLLVLEALAARDARIVPLPLRHVGVSSARNAALARATGDYVAFLDSDKQWEPDFLSSMVAFLEQHGHDAGYAVVEVSTNGRTLYRTTPATHDSLLVANSIDQTAIVVRRSLLERAGGFDETLRRAVDYDLILRLSERTELVQVPYVGVRYSEDDQDPNRISEAQSVAWNFYVRDRHRWAHTELPRTTPGLVSIVLDGVRSAGEAWASLTNLRDHLGDTPAEVLLLPATHSWAVIQAVVLSEFSTLDVRVLPIVGANDRVPLRINHALRAARGEYVYIATAQQTYTQGTILELVDELRSADAAAVHPLVLDKRRLIADAGIVYAPGGRDPVGLLHGLPAGWGSLPGTAIEVPGATLPLLMRASTIRDIGGLNTRLQQLWVDVDASQRAALHESRPVVVRADNVVQSPGSTPFDPKKGAEHDVRMFASLWPTPPVGSAQALASVGASAAFEGFTAASVPGSPDLWSRAVWRPRDERWTESIVHRPERPLQWSIKTAAPADERSLLWGDFHFANSLADALRSLGERVSVDYGSNVDRNTANADDVALVLRGLKEVPLPTGATSVIWVISHPDAVTANELRAYDLRYAASATWPAVMADQWDVEIAPLLQCTDPERFFIDDVRVPEVHGKLVMVGNSRKQYRPAACEAAAAGLPLAIYGGNWEEFVDPAYIAGSYVPNDELRRYYRSAEWALNDHWVDMRDHGFLSNRIFDVLASGGRLLTDRVTGLDGLFPREVLPLGVATFDAPIDLLAIVETGPAKFYDEATLQRISRHVRSEHSFEARARVLLDDVRRHRADRADRL